MNQNDVKTVSEGINIIKDIIVPLASAVIGTIGAYFVGISVSNKTLKKQAELEEKLRTAEQESEKKIRIAEIEAEKRYRAIQEEKRVKSAINRFEEAIRRKHSDILNKGRRYQELVELAQKGKTYVDYIDLREEFMIPISEEINIELELRYEKIKRFYSSMVHGQFGKENPDFVFANEYLEFLESLGLKSQIESEIEKYKDR